MRSDQGNSGHLAAMASAQGLYDPSREHDACGIGFVASIKGRKSHEIVSDSLRVLEHLSHRGASCEDKETGDGAGILVQIPHDFLVEVAADEGLRLPAAGQYAVGMVFLPRDPVARALIEGRIELLARDEGLSFVGWRTVPVDRSAIGKKAVASMPFIRQCFISRSASLRDELDFERRLYIVRKRFEKSLEGLTEDAPDYAYVASLSCRTLVYKGLMKGDQVESFYLDLRHGRFASAIAVVHSRFSTNTFPSWERAHPYRYLIHNGEINTLRGNVNWMKAREPLIRTEAFGNGRDRSFSIIDTNGSDSAMFDNCLEFLALNGRPLAHSMMMMIPEPWEGRTDMSDERRAFYEYHACLMEPWDGPAAMVFSDGRQVGAVLDRNGLRPARYLVTKDDIVVLSSETGALDIPARDIFKKDKLRPGKMLLIDTVEGRIVEDEEIKSRFARERPYRQWLDERLVRLEDLPAVPPDDLPEPGELVRRQAAFGYTNEDLELGILPMAADGADAVGSMGYDAPLAVLSERPQILFDYFKQLFAQVTNPPIDSVREEMVIGTTTFIGCEGDLIHPTPEACRQIKLVSPIIRNDEMAKLKSISLPGFKSVIIPILYPVAEGQNALERAIDRLLAAADAAFADGANILVLSDRGLDGAHAAIPSLLAVSGLHHHLIRNGTRTLVAIALESGEPREVHHFAALIGYGVSAVNPYLALESVADLSRRGHLPSKSREEAEDSYIHAATKGVIKTMAKMGISTIQSYKGAQIFEAVGLGGDFVERYFEGTPSRVGGVGLREICAETAARHVAAFDPRRPQPLALEAGGVWKWRHGGEHHSYNPESIHLLQLACRSGDYGLFRRYAELMNDPLEGNRSLRSLLRFRPAAPVPLDEVEPVESIFRRFKTGAMSYGSISKEAHECLALAMNGIGGRSNTGEGGEDPERYRMDSGGVSRSSAIKQVASARFGVTSEYLVNAKEIQIKMAQGAKPGEGGQLPGKKVYPWIAEVRHSTPGVGLISPSPHHDIYSIEDLAQLIRDLKSANPDARISVKLVAEAGVGTIAAGVAKAGAELVLICGYDGGTGASPRSSIRHAGLPWELGVAETHQTLLLNDLRGRITVEADGKLLTGRDVAIAALLGAEEFGFATLPLVALGCVMMRVCHLDTCPSGIATQNPELRKRFSGKPEHVVNLMRFLAQDLREIMAGLGFRTVDEMVGHPGLLEFSPPPGLSKAATLDFSRILHQAAVPAGRARTRCAAQDYELDASYDRRVLIGLCAEALEGKGTVSLNLPITNMDRVVGTLLGCEITRRFGSAGLPEGAIRLKFSGSAGQSFGAFLPRGVSLELEGDANDYVGKGLSGGGIAVYPQDDAGFMPEDSVIVGNVALYGATSGAAYFRGRAGERFCVRNSGAEAVVEGVSDHGCEYMTGGRVAVLGPTGRNFAAGMSGGLAYVLDAEGSFRDSCNLEMVDLVGLDEEDRTELRGMIERHVERTGSELGRRLLVNWPDRASRFVKVLPKEYQRAREAARLKEQAGLEGREARAAAFDLNAREPARVGGN